MENTPVVVEKRKDKDIKNNIKSINKDLKIISNSIEKINKGSLEQDKVCQCIIV